MSKRLVSAQCGWLLAVSMTVSSPAWGKPSDGGGGAPVARHAARAGGGGGTGDKVIAASVVAQKGMKLSPDSVGLAAEYQMGMSHRWQLDMGAEVGLHDNRTLVQPQATAQFPLHSRGAFDLHYGIGAAVPLQLMSGTTAAALAVRGLFGAQWNWRYSRNLIPHIQAVAVAGPILRPSNVWPNFYFAVQLLIGMSYELGPSTLES